MKSLDALNVLDDVAVSQKGLFTSAQVCNVGVGVWSFLAMLTFIVWCGKIGLLRR